MYMYIYIYIDICICACVILYGVSYIGLSYANPTVHLLLGCAQGCCVAEAPKPCLAGPSGGAAVEAATRPFRVEGSHFGRYDRIQYSVR